MRNYTDSGVENLANAIYAQAAKDYKNALKGGKHDKADAQFIEEFLTSGAYGVRKEIGESIIREIRQKAKNENRKRKARG